MTMNKSLDTKVQFHLSDPKKIKDLVGNWAYFPAGVTIRRAESVSIKTGLSYDKQE